MGNGDDRMVLPLVKLKNLSFNYAGQVPPLIENLDFSLSPQEKLALIGTNGSGKSTLLHLMIGLLCPTGGEIEIFGQRCHQEKDFAPLRGRIGLLFQDADDQLFCPTVAEDIAFGPLNQGKSPKQAQMIVENTLNLIGLSRYAQRITYQLSGGEKRLVALATLLAMQPEVLLLDEPTNGLDEDFQERITEILIQLPQTMLVVSHDREFLNRVTHKQVVLKKGKLFF